MDRGAWWVSPWSHKELDMTEQLNTHNAFAVLNRGFILY